MITNHKRARIVRYFVAFALAWLLAFVPLQTRSKHSSAAAASPATSEFFVTFNQVADSSTVSNRIAGRSHLAEAR